MGRGERSFKPVALDRRVEGANPSWRPRKKRLGTWMMWRVGEYQASTKLVVRGEIPQSWQMSFFQKVGLIDEKVDTFPGQLPIAQAAELVRDSHYRDANRVRLEEVADPDRCERLIRDSDDQAISDQFSHLSADRDVVEAVLRVTRVRDGEWMLSPDRDILLYAKEEELLGMINIRHAMWMPVK